MQTSLLPQETIIETPFVGVTVIRFGWDEAEQVAAVEAARQVVEAAPLFRPKMMGGTEFRLKLTNCGEWGWCAGANSFDQATKDFEVLGGQFKTYRYQRQHPVTGKRWPAIPAVIEQASQDALRLAGLPPCEFQSCLLNFYERETSSLGMHQDKTEQDQVSPIVTWSLGDSCSFRVSESNTGGITLRLSSGDCCILHGAGRMHWHSVSRVIAATGYSPMPKGGRLSLTLRKVQV